MKKSKPEPIPVMDYRQYRRARLVHECCNYDGGNCIALDDGEECVCVQSISYSLLCRWFRAAVLPLDRELETTVLFASVLCIFVLAPANNASLHLTSNEITAIRPRARLRLACVVLISCLLLYIRAPLASCMAVALLAVAVMLVLTNSMVGAQ